MLPFDFEQFEQLYDLRMVLETTAVQRLCADGERVDRALLGELVAIWRVAAVTLRRRGTSVHLGRGVPLQAGNRRRRRGDARVHRDVTERIRIIRRLDFTKPARIEATYDEHAKILRAIQRKCGEQAAMLLRAHIGASQAEVRKITLHQVHLARSAKSPGK